MTDFEDLKLTRFRREWEAQPKPPLAWRPSPSLPVHMIDGWRSVKDDLATFSTIDDEEREDPFP